MHTFRSVGIVRSRTKATELKLVSYAYVSLLMVGLRMTSTIVENCFRELHNELTLSLMTLC